MSDYRLREGWSTVGLLIMMLLCIAWSIGVAEWVDGLPVLVWIVLLGGLFGIVSAKSRVPALVAHSLSGLVGLSWGAWLTSRVLASGTHFSGSEALLELDWRLQTWVGDLVARGASSVVHMMLLVLCLLMWLVAYVSAWVIFRRQRPWAAVIVCSVAMLINVTAAPLHQTWFLLSFLLLALLLIVRTSLAAYEQEWRKGHVHYAPDVVAGFLRAGLTVAVLALALAWIVPTVIAGGRVGAVWDKVREPWRRFQEQWEVAFQDLSSRQAPLVVLVSKSMTFGGPVELTDRPIMDIEAPSGRYWRSRTYDEYLGWGWLNTDGVTLSLEPGSEELLLQPEYAQRLVLTQSVTLREDWGMGRALVVAGDPLRLSVGVQAVVSQLTPTLTIDTPEPVHASRASVSSSSLLYLTTGLPAGTRYAAISSVSAVTAEALRRAGTDYPAWILSRYLQLPESLPSRVRRLAGEITSGLDLPYDKVIAIEAYLRGIPYSQQIKGPQPGQDGVDYFLFGEKSGYCSYYASAMVVLLRAVGVPARYAEGYVHGASALGVYHIIEKDSHAWPEVFYPGFGWVEFEPTAAQSLTSRSPAVSTTVEGAIPGLDRHLPQLDDREDPLLHGRGTGSPSGAYHVPWWQQVPAWVWPALGTLFVVGAACAWLVGRERRRLMSLTPVERTYYRLSRSVTRLLRIRPLEHQTPLEYAGVVASAVPAGGAQAARISQQFVAERFGGKDGDAEEAEAAWRELRPDLWRRWLQLRGERLSRALRWAHRSRDRASSDSTPAARK